MSTPLKDYTDKLKDPNSTNRDIKKVYKLYLKSLVTKPKKRGGQVIEGIYKNGQSSKYKATDYEAWKE